MISLITKSFFLSLSIIIPIGITNYTTELLQANKLGYSWGSVILVFALILAYTLNRIAYRT